MNSIRKEIARELRSGNMKKSRPLKTFGVRADEDQVKRARTFKLDISELFRSALAQELIRLAGRCPTCGVGGAAKRKA